MSAAAAAELEQKRREIFVRNLSYDTTSDELIELFQEIGPIKRGSITQKDGVSRGFGFIKFALEEDASTAISQMNGREFKGRKLIIETAVNKGQNPLLDSAAAAAADGVVPVKAQKASRVSASADAPKLSAIGDAKERKLQLVIFGVTAAVGKKAFRKYLKTLSKKATVHVITADHPLAAWIEGISYDFPSTEASTGAFKPLLVTAPNAADCKKILDTVNAPGGSGLIQRRLLELSQQDGDAEGEAEGSDDGSVGPAVAAGSAVIAARSVNAITEPRLRKRKCRLILRNLSFQATESNISSRLQTFGPMTEVTIARVPVTTESRRRKKADGDSQEPKLKSRGFAFVTYLCEADAKRAVEGCSALKICNREFALDFCTAKDKLAGASDATDGAAAAAEEAQEVVVESSDEESSEGEGEEMDGSEEASAEDSDGEEAPDGEDSEEEEEVKVVKPVKPTDVNEGKTIFIRDLPFDATVQDVRRAFRPFGQVVMCVLVTDKETGLSKGSAFLKYEDAASAEAAVQACNDPAGGASSTGLAHRGPVYVSGKPTRVDLALERDQAKRLDDNKSARGRADGGRDRRNLYLSNEGLGVGSALLEADMPEADKEKRKRAHQEKRKKLQNPLFFVSATRLCVRNLKKAVTDAEFRALCIKATKEGLSSGKVTADDMDVQLASQGLSIRERPAEALVVPNFQSPCPGAPAKASYLKLMKAKIMRDTSRLKAGTTDSAQSRGYGFVEFQHHGHALACLRQLNNNPDYWEHSMSHANQDPTKRPRLIVEFSLEDSRKVNMLKKRNERTSQKQKDGKGEKPTGDAEKKTSNRSKKRSSDQESAAPTINKKQKKGNNSAPVGDSGSSGEKGVSVAPAEQSRPKEANAVVAVAAAGSGVSAKISNKRANRAALKKSKENKNKKQQNNKKKK